mmetsp:Transcript_36942/g.92615  ORF Transcript_36942/g.92615 Transcript_36942/m.92615 type:complete len:206 (-) Transcript_36942:681-1298(-)
MHLIEGNHLGVLGCDLTEGGQHTEDAGRTLGVAVFLGLVLLRRPVGSGGSVSVAGACRPVGARVDVGRAGAGAVLGGRLLALLERAQSLGDVVVGQEALWHTSAHLLDLTQRGEDALHHAGAQGQRAHLLRLHAARPLEAAAQRAEERPEQSSAHRGDALLAALLGPRVAGQRALLTPQQREQQFAAVLVVDKGARVVGQLELQL